ncbi:AAC4-like protein [Mya arenaria]|uniref:AAC4-like protein n=1 Tax=Mya arenaria TaxID=6604 RepID=A0ABY7F6V8_MYAAR|nr:AAC-rich mRNA clone AAC4 protein-like [Mya arenaria]WAR17923.1 AAC4-like protein [Mya arenaria]
MGLDSLRLRHGGPVGSGSFRFLITRLARLPRESCGQCIVSPPSSLYRKKRTFSRNCRNIGRVNTVALVAQTYNHTLNKSDESAVPAASCNMYIGDDFSVRIRQWFRFLACIEDNKVGGVLHCDFTPHRKLTDMSLSGDATKMRDVPNAGGSSVGSEVLSLELLRRCFKAKLIKTEMEVEYFPEGGSITDYVCDVFGSKLGVSVTRARSYFRDVTFSLDDASRLLNKKLRGINQANRNSLENWHKQVLHVWSAGNDITNTLVQAFHHLEPEVVSNTVVLITTTTTACDFIYING